MSAPRILVVSTALVSTGSEVTLTFRCVSEDTAAEVYEAVAAALQEGGLSFGETRFDALMVTGRPS